MEIKSINREIKSIFKISLYKNSMYLIVTGFITSIIGFFFWIIAARYYSTEDIGITSTIFSSISLLSMIGSLGLSRALIYYLPRDNDFKKIINSCLTINIISSASFSIIFILGLGIWSPDLALTLNKIGIILIFMAIAIGYSFSSLIGATFTAGNRSSYQMYKESIYHFVRILPLFLFVGLGSTGILLSLTIGLILSLGVSLIFLYRVWKMIPRFSLNGTIIKSMASFSFGNYISDILYNMPRLLLPILILNMLSAKSAGYFYIAVMMAGFLYGISQSISSQFLVETSDESKFWYTVIKSIKFNMIIIIPGIILFFIFGGIILNIFNKEYAENATITVLILAFTSIPLSLVSIYNAVRNSQNRVMSMVKMNILVAGITLILSIFLIRSMNIEGVAISYFIANAIGAIIVINRIKNPKEFTYIILKDVKKDLIRYGLKI